MIALFCLVMLPSLLAAETWTRVQTSTPSREAGYVVEAAANAWEAVPVTGAARLLELGSAVLPGDTIRLRQGTTLPAETFLDVLLFSTGRIVKLGSGSKVDIGVPPKPRMLQRVFAALQRRLNNEALVPGIVRSGGLIHDSVVFGKGAVEWRHIAPGLTAGPFTGRFRPLGPEGRPAGAWTEAEPFEVTASGNIPAATTAPLRPGLWQVAISHRRVPTVSGDAWILITLDRAAIETFETLKSTTADNLRAEGPDIERATMRVKRAAMLALAEGLPPK